MTSFGRVSQSALTAARSSRPFSNKITSFFGAKAGHITDFSIELDDPLRKYGPGDSVTGKVVLQVAKPLGVTHIVVCLYGYAHVFKTHNNSKGPVRNSSGRVVTGRGKRWVSEYYGDGFASLFEEEIILCGDGRLDPKLYHFRFEIDFPSDLQLPSSIDFERGTVTYMVTSTLTRPTSIGPTSSCDQKVYFQDSIDVGAIPRPKARIVTLEPLDRSSKSRSSLRRLTSHDGSRRRSHVSGQPRTDMPTRSLDSASQGTTQQDSRQASPSHESSRNNSISSRTPGSASILDNKSLRSSQSLKDESDEGAKTIVANIELDKGGCLPGELLPIKITIHHSKVVRTPTGVIATLYRQSRVDMHPALPIAPREVGERTRYEDYYPRSRTGLGGLSLSTAGSSQTWRKDLSQTTAPIYVNPATMSAEIKLVVHVPEDSFPSNHSSPGEMISFKYFVEVIIDIHGKLLTQERVLLSSTHRKSMYDTSERSGAAYDLHTTSSTAVGVECVDTLPYRRDKNAITCDCDLIVGTKDSVKAKGKQKQVEQAHSDPPSLDDALQEHGRERYNGGAQHDEEHEASAQYYGNHEDYYDYDGYDEEGYGYDSYGKPYYPQDDYEYAYHYGHSPRYDEHYATSRQTQSYMVAPPAMPDEANLSEKEQLQRAEARLLPSQPPVDSSRERLNGSSGGPPTAPHISDEGQNLGASSLHASHIDDTNPNSLADSSRPRNRMEVSSSTIRPLMSHEQRPRPISEHGESSVLPPTDDKQELERRALRELASSPDAVLNGHQQTRGDVGAASAPPLAAFDSETDNESAPSMEHVEALADVSHLVDGSHDGTVVGEAVENGYQR